MPKIEARRVAAFLRDPGAERLVLLYGDDPGLVRERSDALLRAVVGGDDPFRVAELARDQAQRGGALAGEAAALAMTGGRRFVRVRDATDALAPAAREVLAGRGEALVVLEAGELPKDEAREAIYGMPQAEWKARHQTEASPEQLRRMADSVARNAPVAP